jgi:pimeloyl-ACP methyl ester carboxylesterase
MQSKNPIIFVHGIQGSWLKDEYPVNYQNSILWTGILHKNFSALELHSLDATVDADPLRLVRPHQAIPIIYESFVNEIRAELRDEEHPYVYVFTYDWRKDNREAAKELGVFVKRILHIAGVHEKGKKRTEPKKVTLIGHSMGGLVIKWYATRTLKSNMASRTIDKIITLATPYGGSLKAIEALLPGARNLFGMENQKSMRHAARTMPGVYQLLPQWPEAVVRQSDGKSLDIFDAKNWQKNLVKSLQNRFHESFFQDMLNDAKTFGRAAVAPWPEFIRQRVYTAVGVDSKTWWQVPVDTSRDNFFHFDKVNEQSPHPDHADGDGTVHTISSLRPELAASHLYRDKKELKDALAGHHANMPNHGRVQDWSLGVLKLNEHADAAFLSPL